MPREIYLVKVGMSMTEGMVSEWFVPDGGTVKKGELVYALETEKVNLDVDAEYDGTVKHMVEVGVMLKPGDVVGYNFETGEEIPADFSGVVGSPRRRTLLRSLLLIIWKRPRCQCLVPLVFRAKKAEDTLNPPRSKASRGWGSTIRFCGAQAPEAHCRS